MHGTNSLHTWPGSEWQQAVSSCKLLQAVAMKHWHALTSTGTIRQDISLVLRLVLGTRLAKTYVGVGTKGRGLSAFFRDRIFFSLVATHGPPPLKHYSYTYDIVYNQHPTDYLPAQILLL